MDITAVIAEYNPFHMGHLLQIEYIRKNFPDTCIAVVMSGDMVQRGELAVFDKYSRAEHALKMGADLVLELPYPYACSSAGYFAKAGAFIANAIGAARLCFGSESGDISELCDCADILLSKEFEAEFTKALREANESGASYIGVREAVFGRMAKKELPDGANNRLALEYICALKELGSKTEPVTYKRGGGFSATLSRKYLRDGDIRLHHMVPPQLYDDYAVGYREPKGLDQVVLWHINTTDSRELAEYADMDVALASRLKAAASDATSLEELYDLCASKKYTNSRIRRGVLNCLCRVKKEHLEEKPAYTVLLGANALGRQALSLMRKEKKIAVITKPADYKELGERAAAQFERSLYAQRLFCTVCGKNTSDIFKKSPVILN